MELIYGSKNVEHKLLEHLAAVAALPNINYIPPTLDTAFASVYLRRTLNLTFFDSHYAAILLHLDGKIISSKACNTHRARNDLGRTKTK